MAKMGQPMLPFLHGAIPAQPDPSDSETEVGRKIAFPNTAFSSDGDRASFACCGRVYIIVVKIVVCYIHFAVL